MDHDQEADRQRKAGNEQYSKGCYKNAIKHYTKGIQATSKVEALGALHSNRAATYQKMGKYSQALEDANMAIQYRPAWGKGYFRKGEIYTALGKLDEALLCQQQALELWPDDSVREKVAALNCSIENQHMGLTLRQLQPGVDLCLKTFNPVQSLIYQFARSMENFIYIIADSVTKEALVVDLCWDMDGVLKILKEEKLTLVGAVVTHYHFDHTGGRPPPPYDQYPVTVDGIGKLVKKYPQLPVYVGPGDADTLHNANGVPREQLKPTNDRQVLKLGSLLVEFIHTPGHTPGSQCLLINNRRLLTGDTLFIGSCGRLDMPDSDSHKMFHSLQKLRLLDESIVVFPGHKYGGNTTTLGREKTHGVLAFTREELFIEKLGHPEHQA